jgi:hypothetical protein
MKIARFIQQHTMSQLKYKSLINPFPALIGVLVLSFTYMYLNIPLLIFTYLGEGNVKCPDGLSSESGYYPGCTCKYNSIF